MRKRLVTRTIKSTVADVMCLDTNTAEVMNKKFTLTGTFPDEQTVLKILKKAVVVEADVELVKVVKVEVVEKHYAMPEEVFIANADEVEELSEE